MFPFGLARILTFISISLCHSQVMTTREFEIRDNAVDGTCFDRTVDDSNMPLECQGNPSENKYILGSTVRGENKYFKVVQKTSLLCMAKNIDRDTICSEMEIPLCCDHEEVCSIPLNVEVIGHSMPCSVKINVKLTDLNDNSPKFPHPIQYLNISESALPGTKVPLIQAKDEDSRKYSVKLYQAEFHNGNPGFQLIQTEHRGMITNLALQVNHDLDRERQETYSFILKAIDGGRPQRTGTTTVSIRIVDVNDNGPVFEKEIYNLRLKESTLYSHEAVLQVKATDKDIGLNSIVKYSFGPNIFRTFDASSYFRLNESTGKLFLIKPLDYERNPHPNFTIIAKDAVGHFLTATATVKIQVENINDEKPEIEIDYLTSKKFKEVKENQQGNTFIAYIHVLDKDAGDFGRVTCDLLNYQDFYKITKQEINHSPGVVKYSVRSQCPLDREKGDRQEINVRCVDTGKPQNTAEAKLYVHILDENDNAPKLRLSGQTHIKENEPPGTLIVTVLAEDPDEGQNGNVTFSIDKSIKETKHFLHIGSLNGQIRTTREIDREKSFTNMLPVIVEASDHGDSPKTTTLTFTVTIEDVNDNAPYFRNNPLTYRETENKDPRSLGEIDVEDKDKDPQLTLQIRQKSDTNLPFKIVKIEGKFFLHTTTSLDRELKEQYHFEIIAKDGHDSRAHTVTAEVTVTVIDENDNAPQIIYPALNNTTVQVSYLERENHAIVKINADDRDVGRGMGQFIFELIDEKGSINKRGSIVMIDTTTGDIKVRREMSRADIGPHWIKVVVRDHGSPPKETSVRIKILVDDSEPNSPARIHPDYPHSIWTDDTTLVFILVIIMILLLAIVTLFIYIRHSRNYFQFLPDLLSFCDKRSAYNNRKDEKKAQIGYTEAATSLNDNDQEMHGVVDIFNPPLCGTISTGELVKLDKQEANRRAQLYSNHYSTSIRNPSRTLPYKNVNYEVIENGAQIPMPRYHNLDATHTLKRLNSDARGSYDALLSPHRQRNIPVYVGEPGRTEHYYQTLANTYEEGKQRPHVANHGHQWSTVSENITVPQEMTSIYNQGGDTDQLTTLNRKVTYYKSDPMLNWDKPAQNEASLDQPHNMNKSHFMPEKYENFGAPIVKSHSKHGLKTMNDRYAQNQLVYDCDHENDAYAVSFPRMQASFV